ncbi:MAG: DMT family transporter [Pseudomonadota bacterium]
MADVAPQPAAHGQGILALVGVTLLFGCMDATAKYLGGRYDPFFVVWARYAGQAVATLVIFAPRLATLARTDRPGLQILRSTLLFTATVLFFTGFSLMPLAEASAIGQLTALFITALAALVLGERVGPYRWSAVVAGFLGAMLIIQPGTGALGWAALLPMAGALAFAAYSIATRVLGSGENPWTTFLYTGSVGALAASLAVPWFWSVPAVADLPVFALLAAAGALGQALLIFAMRLAPASLLAPFLYLTVVWAGLNGYLLFDEVPGPATLAGTAVIVGAGLFVHWRESVRGALR